MVVRCAVICECGKIIDISGLIIEAENNRDKLVRKETIREIIDLIKKEKRI